MRTSGGRGVLRRAGRCAVLVALSIVWLATRGSAQETPPDSTAQETAPDSTAAQETLPAEPEMAEAPLQFRLSGTVGAFFWGQHEGVPEIDNLVNFGIDIESRVVPAVAFRLAGSYGSTTASNDTASIGVNQWEFDVYVVGRLAVGSLTRAGFVPFGMLGAGTIALDPRSRADDPNDDNLTTRSQGAFSFGGGLDIEPESGRWGGRLEYRYYRVSLEDPFNPLDRQGDTIGANLVMASIFYKL